MVDSQVKNNMTQEIKDIWLAEYQRILTQKIAKKYHLSVLDKQNIDQAIDYLYNNDLKVEELNSWLNNRIKNSSINFNDLANDIVGLCLLPAKEYFKSNGQDLDKFLGSNSQNKDYIDNLNIFQKALAEEKNGTYDHNAYMYPAEEPKKLDNVEKTEENFDTTENIDLTPEERELHLKEFFKNNFDGVLDLESPQILDSMNEELAIGLSDNKNLSRELSEIIARFEMKIGESPLKLDDKELSPSLANWLRDFYGVIGTEQTDSLGIAKYLINSENAKKLSDEDQSRLRRFLLIYHNIKNFPTPFASVPPDKWDIIPAPFVEIEQPVVQEPISQRSVKTLDQEELKKNISQNQEENSELLELKNMLLQYPVGSLERAAIEEEIKNLEKK